MFFDAECVSVGYRQRCSDEIGHENVLFLIVAVIAVRPQTANRELCAPRRVRYAHYVTKRNRLIRYLA